MRQIGHYARTYLYRYRLRPVDRRNMTILKPVKIIYLDHQISNDGMHLGLGPGSVQSEEDY